MLPVLLTIDTEYSAGLFAAGIARDPEESYRRCVGCDTADGPAGIHYQMDVFDRHGLTATFFVDPMPSLVWGIGPIERIVKPILERGHDVQLHLHTEWLALAPDKPWPGKTGQTLADFGYEDQLSLLDYAAGQLMAAGAPMPAAFRAGNYGADDATLRALAQLGIRYDTSHAPGIPSSACRISLGSEDIAPVIHHGTLEIPIGLIGGPRGGARHAQITALSHSELAAGVRHAREADWPAFVIVSHSFELVNRRRQLANRIVQRRFERFCEWLGDAARCSTLPFGDLDPDMLLRRTQDEVRPLAPLPHSLPRTAWRMGEQALANYLYG
ncbi:hypothetical protein WAB17_06710 [Parerythrobacter aurantius]|uniref:polysaccharide deacetylase family protein n=1 Tax=Parerythrobacter aurantius TaxID=3127706 RepID=UPI00324C8335